MEFSKFKSEYQRSLRSVFSLTKEWTLASNQKEVVISSLNNFIKYLEYVIFNWKLFCISIKKNYLFQLITLKGRPVGTPLGDYFLTQNYIFLFLKRLKNSRSTIILFFNIPFIISLIISEIFESIIKKTIYLYRFFLLLSCAPVLIFCVNRNLLLHNKKNYFSFILPEITKISACGYSGDYRNGPVGSLYIKNLRETILRNHIFKFISQKINNFNSQKQECGKAARQARASNKQKRSLSYLASEPTFYKQLPFRPPAAAPSRVFPATQGPMAEGGPLGYHQGLFFFNQFPSTNIQTSDGVIKYVDKKSVIFSKWFSLYIKLKKNYSIKFQNNFIINQKKLKNVCRWSNWEIVKSNFNFKKLGSFQLSQFPKKNNYLKQEFLQKIDSFFFSLIKPRDFNFLSKKPFKGRRSRDSAILDILDVQKERLKIASDLLYLEENTNWYQERKININFHLLQSINKQQWMLTIKQWPPAAAPSQGGLAALLKNKQKLKGRLSREFFQPADVIHFLKNFFSFWTNRQIYLNKSLLNRLHLFSLFLSNQQPSVFKSYKNALILKNVAASPPHPPESSASALANLKTLSSHLGGSRFAPMAAAGGPSGTAPFSSNKLTPLSVTINKQIFQKINFLYNFSFHFSNGGEAAPETFFVLQNTPPFGRPLSIFSATQGRPLGPQGLFIENKNIFDLDFYLNNYKPTDDLFWISSSSISYADVPFRGPWDGPPAPSGEGWRSHRQANMLEQEEHQQNQKNFFPKARRQARATACLARPSRFTYSQKTLKVIKKKREKLINIIFSTKLNFLKKYNKWIFTPQWWVARHGLLISQAQSFVENLTSNIQILLYRISTKLSNTNRGRRRRRSTQKFKNISNIFIFKVQNWNKLLVERIYTSQEEKSLWLNLKLLPSVNNSSWSFFAWFIASSIVYYHWLPMLTGVIYLYLWLDFEKIRSLADVPSWKAFLSILTHNSFDSPSQQLRLAGYLARGRLFLIFSQIYRFSNEIFFIFNRLNYMTTLDLSRRNKNLVSNSFITKKTLQSKYYFWNINKQKVNGGVSRRQLVALNGFNFFQKWYEKNCRSSSFLQKNIWLRSFSLKWLNDLFFYNRFLTFDFNNQLNKIYIPSGPSGPIPLLESLTYTQRWLFIGSLESGKSFVIKNLAASTHYPLIHISIKDIKKATPDSKYFKIRKQKRWVEQLSERSFFLEHIFNIAKIVAPSMFWISDLHDFETKNQIQEKNTQKFDISLLMATLLKILSSDLVPEKQNHITFIGSTEYPRLLDPKFVSRQRLDLIVNFRTPSFNQRQSIFTSLLKTTGAIEGASLRRWSREGRLRRRSFYELNSNTLGYTFRDITSLVNETLLIKTTENTTLIDSNIIRLALYRQTSTQSVKYKIIRQENLQYKIGKALVHAILVYPKSMMLLSKYHDLWKTKFYYLSNTYLEVSSKKAITTEFVLLTQILNCLAGSAARDAWILSTKGAATKETPRGPSGFALTSQLKHDFSIASNILQSLLVEFSMRDIIASDPKKKKNREDISKTFHFHFIKRAMAGTALEFFAASGPSYINWSIKGKRLSFNWLLFFSGIEHSTKNLARLLFLDKSKKTFGPPLLEKSIDIADAPYERRETKRQQQKIQKIDSLFNKMIYTMYMEKLGFPWESEYVMDYNPFQFSLFFREARPLWNPQTIMPSYSILFFDRDLIINQKLLTKLYITYGNKFQIEKLNRKRIKKQNFWSNFAFNKVDFIKINEFKKDGVLPPQKGRFTANWADFHFYQNLINLNAQLDQSQIQLPVYLHQGWITADPHETFLTFDILSTKILVNNDHLIYKESFLFEILLEIYHYLLRFFFLNKNIMIHIKEILLKNKILYRQDIEKVLKKYYRCC